MIESTRYNAAKGMITLMAIKMGIIGIGGIFNGAHLPFYLKDKRVEVVALCDIIPERAKAVKEKHFKNARIYTDYTELLKDESIVAVDICTPNYWHSRIAVDAFHAGKHVFCEKPDAVSVEEAEKMKKASEEAGKTLMVMRNNRYLDISRYIKQYTENGNMGDIYCGRCGWVRRRGIPGKGGWFTTKELSGGGPLIDLGPHMLDLAIWIMGNPRPVSVSGNTFTKFADSTTSDSRNSSFGDKVEDGTFDVEDLAIGLIRFDNGAVLQLEFSWASNVERERGFVELRGTKAGFSWDFEKLKIYFEQNGKQKNKRIQRKSLSGGHDKNLAHFIDVIEGKARPCYQPWQGVDLIKILSAIYESAESGKEVLL